MVAKGIQTVVTSDDISWHVEIFQHDSGPDGARRERQCIVLIPSGEGDCHSLEIVANSLASRGYTIITFDTPGFSRTIAPPTAYEKVTPQLLATQIIGLLEKLCIAYASFFGCSSGALATMALCALYPDRVRCGITHEAPLEQSEALANILNMSDEEISAVSPGLYAKDLIEQDVDDGVAKWKRSRS